MHLKCVFLALFVAALTTMQAIEPEQILKAYTAARPVDGELGVFLLDWAESFKDAKARAAKEQRPVFLVCTTQLKDAGNLRDGHC